MFATSIRRDAASFAFAPAFAKCLPRGIVRPAPAIPLSTGRIRNHQVVRVSLAREPGGLCTTAASGTQEHARATARSTSMYAGRPSLSDLVWRASRKACTTKTAVFRSSLTDIGSATHSDGRRHKSKTGVQSRYSVHGRTSTRMGEGGRGGRGGKGPVPSSKSPHLHTEPPF